MVLKQSNLLSKVRRHAPTDAESISHKLLARAGFIDQLASGIFSWLPLGYLTLERIQSIIREEMRGIGAMEVLLPALQPASLWQESGRLTVIDPPLFAFQDRHEKDLVLGSTHEEVITDLARKYIESYKDLPLAAYQIQTKFRNEVRATGGLLRVREFLMKDLYSFHTSEEDLQQYYAQVQEAYKRMFARCGVTIHVVRADSGTIGGAVSHEFSIEAPAGEDQVVVCTSCGAAVNTETLEEKDAPCQECGGAMKVVSCIENGHTFQLGTKYSEVLGAMFTSQDGQKHPVVMGCYGIGVGRLMAAIIEVHHDERGMIWPKEVAPVAVHVLTLQPSMLEEASALAQKLGETHDVLLDDREMSPGAKFAEADLIGIPTRLVVSEKTKAAGKIEVTDRASGKSQMLDEKEFLV